MNNGFCLYCKHHKRLHRFVKGRNNICMVGYKLVNKDDDWDGFTEGDITFNRKSKAAPCDCMEFEDLGFEEFGEMVRKKHG